MANTLDIFVTFGCNMSVSFITAHRVLQNSKADLGNINEKQCEII